MKQLDPPHTELLHKFMLLKIVNQKYQDSILLILQSLQSGYFNQEQSEQLNQAIQKEVEVEQKIVRQMAQIEMMLNAID